MKAILMILGGVVGLFLLGAWWAYAIHIVWGWFLVPIGVPSVGIAHAYGLSVLAGLFMNTRGLDTSTKSTEDWTQCIFTGIMMPAIALLFGCIAVGFM